MALNLMPAIEVLRQKLEELKAQGLYYAGELVFASDDQLWNKIDPLSFHLYDVRHAEKLDRIVMLFTDQAVTKAAMLVIEKEHISCTGAQDGTFLIDAFRSMQHSDGSVLHDSSDYSAVGSSVRLICDKPLFLTLLYRHNLLRQDVNLQAIESHAVSAGQNKDLAFYKEVREILIGFFSKDIWRQEFPRLTVPFDPAELAEALAKYLDGLQVMQQLLWDSRWEKTESPNVAALQRRCREIEDLIRILKDQMSQLAFTSRLEVPHPTPEMTIALWRCDECFPVDMGFGELICIRAELEWMLEYLNSNAPGEESTRRDKLREYRLDILWRQLREVDSLLENKTGDMHFDWKAYLGDL